MQLQRRPRARPANQLGLLDQSQKNSPCPWQTLPSTIRNEVVVLLARLMVASLAEADSGDAEHEEETNDA